MEIDDDARVDAIKKSWRDAGLGAREAALCHYAEKLTLNPAQMSRGDLQPLREQGLDDAAILDLVQVIAYFNYINRVADALGVPVEDDWGESG